MTTIYIYILDTLADWEIGLVTAELNSGRFFKEEAPQITLKTVSCSLEPVTSMGGLKITPDCLVEDVAVNESSMLLLPGADKWNEPKHRAILEKAGEFLSSGAALAAICGATAALADYGLLDNRPHTGNGPGYLEMFSPNYKGQNFYIDEPSIADNKLITAGPAASLLWTKQILSLLDVFREDTLEAWYDYFRTGKSEYFFALMQTLPAGK